MAWFVNNELSGKYSVRSDQFPVNGISAEELLALSNAVRIGLEIPENSLPLELYLKASRVQLADFFFAVGGVPVISERLKLLVEEFEPARKQFFPVSIRKSKRGSIIAKYYFFNMLAPLRAVVPQQSQHVDFGLDGLGRETFLIQRSLGDVVCGIERKVVGVRQIWNDTRQLYTSGLFVSDLFFDEVTKKGMTGMKIAARCLEID